MHNLRRRLGLVLATAIAAAVPGTTGAAAQDPPAWTVTACQPASLGAQLWRDLQPGLHPAPGSPAAFRLADQRDLTLWLNTLPDLRPTSASPAAFRLADQRNLVATAAACLRAGAGTR